MPSTLSETVLRHFQGRNTVLQRYLLHGQCADVCNKFRHVYSLLGVDAGPSRDLLHQCQPMRFSVEAMNINIFIASFSRISKAVLPWIQRRCMSPDITTHRSYSI